jgi:hypothetical protein
MGCFVYQQVASASLNKIRFNDRLSGKLRTDEFLPLMLITDQGKPVARRGRKASGLVICRRKQDSGVAGTFNRCKRLARSVRAD